MDWLYEKILTRIIRLISQNTNLRANIARSIEKSLRERGALPDWKPSADPVKLEEALHSVESWLMMLPSKAPKFALILGSGLAEVKDSFQVLAELPYMRINHLGRPTAPGHRGVLYLVELDGIPGLIFSGRRHWYEGEGWTGSAIPPFIARKLGAKLWITTTACGGIREDCRSPGTLVLVDEFNHSFPFDPIFGAQGSFGDESFWGRQDLKGELATSLRAAFKQVALEAGVVVREGPYFAEPGPDFETESRVQELLSKGAAVVGMSGVETVLAARGKTGMGVLHLAVVTNTAAGLKLSGGAAAVPNEGEVLEEAQEVAPLLGKLVTGFISRAI